MTTVAFQEAPTNFVPAVAVKRRVRALFVLIGCKGYVGGQESFDKKSRVNFLCGVSILDLARVGERLG